MTKILRAKIKESLLAVLPITAIVILLVFTVAPIPLGSLALFLCGAFLLILGMGLFTLGADVAMMPMGEHVGAQLTKSRKISLVVILGFIIGCLITIAEPDLQVLAGQTPGIPNFLLVITVAIGVGAFLVLALLRIIFRKKLMYILILFYLIVFGLAAFVPSDFVPLAFDSGGVTTGPITVPFILSLGVGVAAVRSGRNAHEDSFGLVAICSIGPILAVLILGMLFDPSGASAPTRIAAITSYKDLLYLFADGFAHYFKEVALALLPIILIFAVFQLVFLHLPKKQLIKIIIGLVYTYLGLVAFLTGVNIAFSPIGNLLGTTLASLSFNWILIPLGVIMGFFVLMAEPAVHVLTRQVEDVSDGAITRKAMLISLALAVGASVGIAMLRVIIGISLWYFIIPGYALALILSFFVKPIFTAIAFDSGGVASGPMTATFLLPLAMGACSALGGNILTDAFGLVALVAMTPLITIQIMGLITRLKLKYRLKKEPDTQDDEFEVIDLYEEEE